MLTSSTHEPNVIERIHNENPSVFKPSLPLLGHIHQTNQLESMSDNNDGPKDPTASQEQQGQGDGPDDAVVVTNEQPQQPFTESSAHEDTDDVPPPPPSVAVESTVSQVSALSDKSAGDGGTSNDDDADASVPPPPPTSPNRDSSLGGEASTSSSRMHDLVAEKARAYSPRHSSRSIRSTSGGSASAASSSNSNRRPSHDLVAEKTRAMDAAAGRASSDDKIKKKSSSESADDVGADAASVTSSIKDLPPPPPLQTGVNYSRPGAVRMSTSGATDEDDTEGDHFEGLFSATSSASSVPPMESPLPPPGDSQDGMVMVEASLVMEDSTVGDSQIMSAPVEHSRNFSAINTPNGSDDGTGPLLASTPEVVQAQPVEERPPFWKNRTYVLLAILGVLVVAGAGAGIAVGITQSNRGSDSDSAAKSPPAVGSENGSRNPTTTPQWLRTRVPTSTPTVAPTSAPPTLNPTLSFAPTLSPTMFFPMIEKLRASLPVPTVAALADPTSPQAKAFAFCQADPRIETYTIQRTQQRFALATFYYAMNGDNWSNKLGWMTNNTSECTWFSSDTMDLICSDDTFTSLTLENNRLRGTLPDELGILSSLSILDLSSNPFIRGPLPKGISDLWNLEFLIIYETQLSGVIPTYLVEMPSLYYIDLEDNRLTGTLPTEFGEMIGLEDLYLHGNNFTGTLPDEYSQLALLESLAVGSNFLEGTIPASYSQLGNLLVFDVGYNNFTNNFFEERIPQNWPFLSYLNIGDNYFGGQLTTAIGELTELTFLDVFYNAFTGRIPTELGLLTNMEILYMEDNLLRGTIPTELGNMSSLTLLHLYGNQLRGTVPPQLCTLIETNGLDLAVDCDLVECDCGCNCNVTFVRSLRG